MNINELIDKPTQELCRGIDFLLTKNPKSKVRIAYGVDFELLVTGAKCDLPEQDKKLLESWNWKVTYYKPVGDWDESYTTCLWEYSLKYID